MVMAQRGSVTMVMAQRERTDIYSDTLASFPGRSQFLIACIMRSGRPGNEASDTQQDSE